MRSPSRKPGTPSPSRRRGLCFSVRNPTLRHARYQISRIKLPRNSFVTSHCHSAPRALGHLRAKPKALQPPQPPIANQPRTAVAPARVGRINPQIAQPYLAAQIHPVKRTALRAQAILGFATAAACTERPGCARRAGDPCRAHRTTAAASSCRLQRKPRCGRRRVAGFDQAAPETTTRLPSTAGALHRPIPAPGGSPKCVLIKDRSGCAVPDARSHASLCSNHVKPPSMPARRRCLLPSGFVPPLKTPRPHPLFLPPLFSSSLQ